ncbi:MAG: hypothetical protein LBI04_03670 [Treponema sp.]|jgi:hypothetical protein|nr:hypothetical protein [Treponema sp.]
MKNTIKWFGIIALVAVIGFSMAACGDDNGGGGGGGGGGTSGKLTITGFPEEYNDKYCHAELWYLNEENQWRTSSVVAYDRYELDDHGWSATRFYAKIEDNSATLKVYDESGFPPKNYKKTEDSCYRIYIHSNQEENQGSPNNDVSKYIQYKEDEKISFVNGIGTLNITGKTFSNYSLW